MLRKQLIALCMGVMFSCKAPGDKQTTESSELDVQINVQLVDTSLNNSVHCGVIRYIEGMKFKLLESNKTIVLLVPCPELRGDQFFQTGSIYWVTLEIRNTGRVNGSVSNRYEKENLDTYLVKDIKRSSGSLLK